MKIGSNKGKIIAVSLLRFIIMAVFLGGIYVSSRDYPNFNNGAFTAMVILGVAFAASPLRHLNDVLVLCSNKIVLKKRELSFSTPEEIEWLYKRTYFVGTRLKCCKDTKSTGWKEIIFPYNEIDVTYIKEPHEEFIRFYMNTIQGESEHVDLMDNHLMSTLGIIFGGIIAYYWAKYLIDSNKGINSQARYKVLEILKKMIPAEEKYVPVYAYWQQGSRMISSGKYYAMGITDDRLYIVPLYIAGEEIGYKDSYVITRDSLGKIDSGKSGGSMRFVYLYDKNQKEIFKFTVDEKNTKLDKSYPVNITQTSEFYAFFAKLDEWKNNIPYMNMENRIVLKRG